MTEEHFIEKTIYLIVFIYFTCIVFLDSMTTYWWKLKRLLTNILKNETFSVTHHLIDSVALFYVIMVKSQYLIALLLSCIIAFNYSQYNHRYLRENFTILHKFNIALFHSTFELLPFSLSLTYYDPYDVVINLLFIIVSVSFATIIFIESKRINIDADNSIRINHIFALCIILDYIHIILLLLCKVYTESNYFFYKFVFQSYPFCIGLQIALCYWEYSKWWTKLKRNGFGSEELKNSVSCFTFLFIVVPVGAECINASWIILLYNEIFRKLRHSKNFEEDLKDSLVEWLNTNKNDLLLKICCINHVKLLKEHGAEIDLLLYLDKHHRNGNTFYGNVSWNGIRNNSSKLKRMNLMETICENISRFYGMHRIVHDVKTNWNRFRNDQRYLNFMRLLAASWEMGALIIFITYGVLTIFDVFSSPLIVFVVMNNTLNMHQICVMTLYLLIQCITLYKLYEMVNYERMMWYIMPDLSTSGCTETEIEQFKKHYNRIKCEFIEIQQILNELLGNDIANIILLFLPDDIHDYKIDNNPDITL